MTDEKKKLRLGATLRDRVTGFTGIATAYDERLSGTRQYVLQPPGDGKTIPESYSVDVETLEYVDDGLIETAVAPPVIPFTLGEPVEDKRTGASGVITSIATFINGCVTLSVLPKMGKDGKMPDAFWIDWKSAKTLSKPKPVEPPEEKQKRGGATTRSRLRPV